LDHDCVGDTVVADRPGATTTDASVGDKEVVREQFNSSGVRRWKKIYGNTN